MNLTQAIEGKRGLPYTRILEELRAETEDVLGTIRGDNLRDVVVLLAGGLQHRLDNAENSGLRTSLLTGFRYMGMDNYGFNMADPKVSYLWSLAFQQGLVTPEEHAKVVELATYKKPRWPDVTLRDIVGYFEPSLTSIDEWTELSNVTSNKVMLKLSKDLPEKTTVSLEMRESHNGEDWTAWRRLAPFVGVQEVAVYYQAVPNQGLHRRIRWKGDNYPITGTVESV